MQLGVGRNLELLVFRKTAITARHLIQVYLPIFGYNIILFGAAVWCYPPIPEAYTAYKAALLQDPFWTDEYGTDIIFVATPSVSSVFFLAKTSLKFKEAT